MALKKYKVKVNASWGFVGGTRVDEINFEMEENATDEQIEQEAGKIAFDWACEYLDIGYDVKPVS